MSGEPLPPPRAEAAGPGDRHPPPPGDPDALAGESEPGPTRVRIDVPARVFVNAVLAVLLTILLVRFFEQVAAVGLLLTLAFITATVLDPLVGWLERHRFGRGLASFTALAATVLVGLLLLALVVPPLVEQGIALAKGLPELLPRLRRGLVGYPGVYAALERRAVALQQDPSEFFSGFLRFGAGVVSVIASGVLILTLALYVLIDKERLRASVLRHTPRRYRDRLDRTITESAAVVRAYFTGQAIVSTIFATFTFVLLSVLGVPYAGVLAAIAFFLDAIPNIGSLLATVAPALVAVATTSLTTALIVVAAFMIYQQIENNLISPRIISGRLHIPPILTLIAILVGGQALGVIGIILAIPLAGTLPVIDRIWITGDDPGPPAEPEEPLAEAAD